MRTRPPTSVFYRLGSRCVAAEKTEEMRCLYEKRLIAGVATLAVIGLSSSLALAIDTRNYSPSQAFNGNDGYQSGENPYKSGGGTATNTRCKRVVNGRCRSY